MIPILDEIDASELRDWRSPYWYLHLIRIACWMGGGLLCLWRCYLLWFDFHYKTEFQSLVWQTQLDPNAKSANWFIQNRNTIFGSPSHSYLLVYLLWTAYLFLFAWILQEQSFELLAFVVAVMLWMHFVPVLFLYSKISPAIDAYHITDELKLQILWSLIPLILITVNPIVCYHVVDGYVHWSRTLQAFYVYTINDEIVVWSALGICYLATVWVYNASAKDVLQNIHDDNPVLPDFYDPSLPAYASLNDPSGYLSLPEVLASRDGFTLFMVGLLSLYAFLLFICVVCVCVYVVYIYIYVYICIYILLFLLLLLFLQNVQG
ncbi:hypothetical protein RFI_13063 [Reticulomyxa filosa]|uniref:Uncharacterized protein n=1 Tax=Reticulomyxa filosa TaxID=46433 RepID=X6NDL7_RETFI|nr:hypothetical protein RFI_13063 [Reticulomyxa filosa]|eukprot:ETO24096.1 hypothetical protein RFI_13063 [Reticulomyxa filosa]